MYMYIQTEKDKQTNTQTSTSSGFIFNSLSCVEAYNLIKLWLWTIKSASVTTWLVRYMQIIYNMIADITHCRWYILPTKWEEYIRPTQWSVYKLTSWLQTESYSIIIQTIKKRNRTNSKRIMNALKCRTLASYC